MKITIYSMNPLSDGEIQKVKSIMEESDCPNESLRKTFPNYDHIDGDKVYFDRNFRDFTREIDFTAKDG